MATRERRSFGHVRRLKSGRWQGGYSWKGKPYTLDLTYPCPRDIPNKKLARTSPCRTECAGCERGRDPERNCEGWQRASAELGRIEYEIKFRGFDPAAAKAEKNPPKPPTMITLSDYFLVTDKQGKPESGWIVERRVKGGEPLAATSRENHSYVFRHHIEPTFGETPLDEITLPMVRTWHAKLLPGRARSRAMAYSLLRSILNTAVEDELIQVNPCRIKDAGTVKRQSRTRVASLPELAAIVEATPERYRCMVLLACWCSMRYGEVAALTRGDLDLKAGVVRVDKNVVWTEADGKIVKPPKTEAGIDTVTIPPHIVGDLQDHLDRFAQRTRAGLMFPFPDRDGDHMRHYERNVWWYPARLAAGRKDLRFHDLRVTGATLAAHAGATVRELQHRLGHATPYMAMHYQRVAEGRGRLIADRMAEMATGNVVPIDSKRKRKAS